MDGASQRYGRLTPFTTASIQHIALFNGSFPSRQGSPKDNGIAPFVFECLSFSSPGVPTTSPVLRHRTVGNRVLEIEI